MSPTEAVTETSLREFSRRLKERAIEEGFEKVGIVPAERLHQETSRLLTWLYRRYHGEMQWMARDLEVRSDPRKFFPAARSVIVVAKNYYTPAQHRGDLKTRINNEAGASPHDADASPHDAGASPHDAGASPHDAGASPHPATGKVSRYAWGDDYHDVVGAKLRSLLAWIKEAIPNVEGKVCVDIQPMMDKAWGQRAGLGWIGKHTNLITTEYGSWVFIGELLLNIDLEYDDEIVADHCGSCTFCIDACPTSAITEPYVVDSNKCISYATIELRRAELPAEVAENLEGWLYGCDICQDVCPWNRFEQTTDESRFQPRVGNVNADLSEIATLTPETYAERFRGSAMKRAKLSGLQRNARALLEIQSTLLEDNK